MNRHISSIFQKRNKVFLTFRTDYDDKKFKKEKKHIFFILFIVTQQKINL